MAFRPQQLTVVWNLLLQTDSEGPPFIFDTASCSYEHVLDTTPHRSVRAELPHTALPLDNGVEESAHSPTSTVWEIHEYQPPRSPEEQKWIEEALRGFDHTPDKPVRWEGDQGYDEGDEEEARRR